ncbi:MAG: endonuclease/exonuclease/phosphatase family protein [Bacteroidota bacterium]|jgi:endonuclease/exonuclease/phosphatase family metal-dependent hydrolase|nr:endonuclease/exonuclease/phosphatase family protein [Bacteroidota bacterium]
MKKSCIQQVPGLLLLCLGLLILMLSSCSLSSGDKTGLPSLPLISIDFDGEVVNSGVLPVVFRGHGNVSYTDGVDGQALDLSHTALFRKPIIVSNDQVTRITDYPGTTLLLWTRLSPYDFNNYVIVGQKNEIEDFEPFGWTIETGNYGSWSWHMTDGVNEAHYNPLPSRQPINDGKWHMVGFSVNFQKKEVRLYYDGVTVAIYSLAQEDFSIFNSRLFIGADPYSADPVKDCYNGVIDNLTVWSRVLSDSQVKAIFEQYKAPGFKQRMTVPDTISVMSWNTWGGGVRSGKFVGVHRIAEIIRESGADIISMQDGFGTEVTVAEILGFYLYKRSGGLSVISRYPLGETYDIYRRRASGAVTVELPNENPILFCPVYLNFSPNNGPYIMSGVADPDTLMARELESRGAEMRYIVWELQTLVDRNDDVPLILAGDFNSGSHLDWTEENKDLHYGVALEYPATYALTRAGFIDSYRQLYPDVRAWPGHTWSPIFKEVLHDRESFIFYNGSRLEPLHSRVINTHELSFPSDHGALITSFKLKKSDLK